MGVKQRLAYAATYTCSHSKYCTYSLHICLHVPLFLTHNTCCFRRLLQHLTQHHNLHLIQRQPPPLRQTLLPVHSAQKEPVDAAGRDSFMDATTVVHQKLRQHQRQLQYQMLLHVASAQKAAAAAVGRGSFSDATACAHHRHPLELHLLLLHQTPFLVTNAPKEAVAAAGREFFMDATACAQQVIPQHQHQYQHQLLRPA